MVPVVPGDEGRRLGSVSSIPRRAALDQAARSCAAHGLPAQFAAVGDAR
jgi:hypothetical protein